MQKLKYIGILGSTGSIGKQTLDIIKEYPDLFKANLLTANNNWKLLAEQAKFFLPEKVVIANSNYLESLKRELEGYGIEVFAGADALSDAVKMVNLNIVVTAMVGYSGLLPTIEAIRHKKNIALSNKETLVVAGEIITALAKEHEVNIIPVDSEHSAIFQCLIGEKSKSLHKIFLTASGGPFRTTPKEDLEKVTVEQTLKHPNWNMGAKVTVDSATMMNKGFEMIEAKWLFNCKPEEIEILIHPQSIIHSMVEFIDGSVKAQLGVPDMRLPIRFALGYPDRLYSDQQRLKLSDFSVLSFEAPDYNKFPLLRFAFEAIDKGGNAPCILNAANEVGVQAFLEKKISFTSIGKLVRFCLDNIPFISNPSLEALISSNSETAKLAQSLIINKAF